MIIPNRTYIQEAAIRTRKPFRSSRTNKQDLRGLNEVQHTLHPFFGLCFPCSQFLFYFLGGYSNPRIKLMRTSYACRVTDEISTPHWFCVLDDSEILDFTSEQFEEPVNYNKSRRANFGFPYFKRNSGLVHENTVPSTQVMEMYKLVPYYSYELSQFEKKLKLELSIANS